MKIIRNRNIHGKQFRIFTSKPCIKFINCKFDYCNIELVVYEKPKTIIFDNCDIRLCNVIILSAPQRAGLWAYALNKGIAHNCRITRKNFNGMMQAIARIKNQNRYMQYDD